MKSGFAPFPLLLAVALGSSGCALYGATTGWEGTGVEGVLALPERADSGSGPFVVYLEGAQAPERPVHAGAVVEHDGEAFRPALAVTGTGEGLTLRNHSGVHHRLFWFSGGRRQSVALEPEAGAAVRLEPAESGVARVYCELHPDEHLTVFAVPTPLYTVLERPGPFAIDAVPPGSWRLHVWSEHFEAGARQVEVQPFETTFQKVRLGARAP